MAIEKGPDQKKNDTPEENPNEQGEIEDDELVLAEEYLEINRGIDQLNKYLDHVEEKNAKLHQQLVEQLKESKAMREEFQKMLVENTNNQQNDEGVSQ